MCARVCVGTHAIHAYIHLCYACVCIHVCAVQQQAAARHHLRHPRAAEPGRRQYQDQATQLVCLTTTHKQYTHTPNTHSLAHTHTPNAHTHTKHKHSHIRTHARIRTTTHTHTDTTHKHSRRERHTTHKHPLTHTDRGTTHETHSLTLTHIHAYIPLSSRHSNWRNFCCTVDGHRLCNTDLVDEMGARLAVSPWFRRRKGIDHLLVASHWLFPAYQKMFER